VRALDPPDTTNPIESTFATVRHRTKVHGSKAAWSRWCSPRATFVNGNLVERPGEHAAGEGEPPRTVPREVVAQAA